MACATPSRIKNLVLVTVVAAVGGILTGCGGGGEEQEIISGFFRAAQYDDRATMGNVSMVDYDASVDGVVTNVSVQSVGEEQRRTLNMREMSETLVEARAAQEEHAASMKEYQDENLEAISRVIDAERAEEDVARGDTEIQEMWTQFRDEQADLTGAVSDAEQALSSESRVADLSALDPANPINVRAYDGELVSKDVTITANVELDGVSEERTMVVTLEKVELGSGEEMIDGRWLITAIE